MIRWPWYGSALEAPDGPTVIRWLAVDAGVRHRRTVGRPSHHRLRRYAAFARRDRSALGAMRRDDGASDRARVLTEHLGRPHAPARAESTDPRSYCCRTCGSGRKEQGLPGSFPSFCSHIVSTAVDDAPPRPFSPENGIQCATNETFAWNPLVAGFSGADLYLRTSGSTGAPKLARMSQQKWLNNAMGCVRTMDAHRRRSLDRAGADLPQLRFRRGLPARSARGSGDGPPPGGNIVSYVDREAHFKPNIALLTPAMCDTFLARRRSPRAYRLVVTAGDRVKPETVTGFESRFGPLLNLYGSAEMGAVSTSSPSHPARPALAPPVIRWWASICAPPTPDRTATCQEPKAPASCNAGRRTALPDT